MNYFIVACYMSLAIFCLLCSFIAKSLQILPALMNSICRFGPLIGIRFIGDKTPLQKLQVWLCGVNRNLVNSTAFDGVTASWNHLLAPNTLRAVRL